MHGPVTGKVRRIAAQRTCVRRINAPALLAFWHLASLDAPTVAVVWSLAFAWSADVPLPIWAPMLLALMAWSVYVGDRLLDARTGLRALELHPLHERHYFHWRHRRIFVPLAAVAALVAVRIILVNMPNRAVAPNTLLGAAAFAYFSGVHAHRKLPRPFTKELLVGIIFTSGCMLPALLRMRASGAGGAPLGIFLVPVIFFAVLAWLNCHAIAQWESGRAVCASGASVATLGCSLAVAGVILACVFWVHDLRSAALLVAGSASALLLALLDREQPRLTPLALRAAADLVLLTPVLLLALARLPR